jgi:ribosomal protein S27AE
MQKARCPNCGSTNLLVDQDAWHEGDNTPENGNVETLNITYTCGKCGAGLLVDYTATHTEMYTGPDKV